MEIHKAEEDELVLKVEPFSLSEKSSDAVKLRPNTEPSDISSESKSSSSDKTIDSKVEKGRRSAIRQLSECSSDDLVGTHSFSTKIFNLVFLSHCNSIVACVFRMVKKFVVF